MKTEIASTSPLLTYNSATMPAPLQVNPAQGTITITIPVPSSTVYCNQMALGIPYGTDVGSLSVKALTTANVGVSPSSRWQIGVGNAKDYKFSGTIQAFVLSPVSTADAKIDYSIVITIHGFTVNSVVGPFEIQVQESSGTDGKTYSKKSTSIKLSKSPYSQFYVENFVATKGDGSGALVAEVDYDSSVILEWAGSQNQYSIIYDENTPVDIASDTSWTSPKLTQNTVFVLQATQQTNLDKNGRPTLDSQTLYLYKTLVVKVKTPDVTANTLNVSGTTTLVGQSTINSIVAGALQVNDNANVGGTLGVTGVTTLGDLIVGGTTSAQALTASGVTTSGLSVGGSSSLSDVAVGGALTAGGTVSMVQGPQPLASGTTISQSYAAQTDGFIVGRVIAPSSANPGCVAWANAFSGSIWMNATGGNMGAFGPGWSDWQASNNNSFLLPVTKGNTAEIQGTQASGDLQQADATIEFYWVPLGVVSSGESITKISDKTPNLDAIVKPLSQTATRPRIVFEGENTLKDGLANISFEDDQIKLTRNASYLVFITPLEECNGLTAIERSGNGFYVKELLNGKSSASFAWQVVVKPS